MLCGCTFVSLLLKQALLTGTETPNHRQDGPKVNDVHMVDQKSGALRAHTSAGHYITTQTPHNQKAIPAKFVKTSLCPVAKFRTKMCDIAKNSNNTTTKMHSCNSLAYLRISEPFAQKSNEQLSNVVQVNHHR